jgi:hypothetical protein
VDEEEVEDEGWVGRSVMTVSNGFVFPAKACFQAYLEQSAFELGIWSGNWHGEPFLTCRLFWNAI